MFRKLLTLDEAERVLRHHFEAEPVGMENVQILEAINRILAEDVKSSLDVPPFDRSTVDGYAVKAEDTFGAEENRLVYLKVRGFVGVGELPEITVIPETTAEIVTGAPLPRGADAVVMKEYTKSEDDEVCICRAVAREENIMRAGTDIKKGEKVLKSGQVLGSREIGVLAAIGKAKAKVYAIPKVAVLSTGSEVTDLGRKLPVGRIYDVNAYSLSAAVLEAGGHPIHHGVFPDEKAELERALKKGLSSADLVVTSGGVSVGPKDLMPRTVDSLGKPGVIVSGIAVKPGKPTTIAVVNRKLIFSLPGHPTSALLMFHLLVRPVIRMLAGRRQEECLETKATCGMRVFPAKGRRTFVMVKLKRDRSKKLVAEPVVTGSSGAITTLAEADGFVEIDENVQFVDSGEEVTVRLFKNVDIWGV